MISVDPRAGSGDLYGPLRRLGLPVRLKRMRFGDFAFHGFGPRRDPPSPGTGTLESDSRVRIGIEYKKLDDLLTCIIDKRLSSHQLPGLVKRYDYRYLLILGTTRPKLDSGLEFLRPSHTAVSGRDYFEFAPTYTSISYPQLQRYLFTLENLANVKVRFAASPRDVVGFISSLYHWWQKPWGAHHSHLSLPSHIDNHPRSIAIAFRRPSVLRRVASALPGIGWTRSEAVARKFRSVVHMVKASREEWLAIPGIGAKTTEAIYRALHTEDKKGR